MRCSRRRRFPFDTLSDSGRVHSNESPAEENDEYDHLFASIEEEELHNLPSDTETALLILREQCSYSPPILLRSLLYYLLKDLTTLNRDLRLLQYEGKIHEFQLPFSTETFYIFVDDLRAELAATKISLETLPGKNLPNASTLRPSKRDFSCLGGFLLVSVMNEMIDLHSELFSKNVVSVYIGQTITLQLLLELMYPNFSSTKGSNDIVYVLTGLHQVN